MKPIEPAELSALIDGELTPDRAEEIRTAIGQNEALKTEYEQLLALDHDWVAAAQTANFAPRIQLALTGAKSTAPVSAAVSFLTEGFSGITSILLIIPLVVRLLTKMMPMDYFWAVLWHSLALLLVLVYIEQMSTSTPRNAKVRIAPVE